MSQGAAGFDQAVESYYKAWFRYHPEAAVEAGVPGYARLLTPFGDDERGALVNLNDALIDALDELGVTSPLPSWEVRREGSQTSSGRLCRRTGAHRLAHPGGKWGRGGNWKNTHDTLSPALPSRERGVSPWYTERLVLKISAIGP